MPIFSFGQDYLIKGNAAFNIGHYESAIKYFSKYENIKSDPDILERRGLAYFNINELSKAIWDFTQAKKLGNNTPSLYLKMAQIKQHQREFDQAIFFYQEFINQAEENSADVLLAKRELKNCIHTAIDTKPKDVAFVQSFGEDVNTVFDEIYPMQSPNFGNVFYIASNNNLKDFDIQSYSINEKGDWNHNKTFGEEVNTRKHDIIQDISSTGQTLLFQKNGAEDLDKNLVFSTFVNDEEIKINIPRTVLKDVHDVQIVNHNTLAFSSKNLKGYGGYDIYTIEYKEGVWSEPMNVGPSINTIYDERFPFFTLDLNTVYFSSNRTYSYGGFDIYYIEKRDKQAVSLNIGAPINSAGNDINFKLNEEGQMGLFSSDRKTGIGGFDVYFAYMKNVSPIATKDSVEFEFITDFLSKQEQEVEIVETSKREKEKAEKELAKREEENDKKEAELKRAEEIAAAEKLQKEILANNKKEPTTNTTTEPKAETVFENEPSSNVANIETSSSSLTDRTNEAPIEIDNPYDTKELEAIDSYVIYYQDRNDLMNEVNKPKLHALAHYLRKEDWYVKIVTHTDYTEPGLPEFVQYNTLLRANTVSDYLLKLGVKPNQICVESVAANYPVAKRDVAGKTNDEFQHYNKRIDFEITDRRGKEIKNHQVNPEDIPLHSRDRKYILFKDIQEELYYSVQVASTKRIFKNAVLRLYDDIYIRRESSDGLNDYYIGIYTNYNDALDLKKKLESSSVPNNEVVAFYNGRKIENSDIEALTAEYPDLSNYKGGRE